MAEARIPYSWEGQQVETEIVGTQGVDSRYGTPKGLTAHYCTGTLETVTDLGIVASLSDPDGEDETQPASTFYPWSSVVSLRLAQS